MNWLSNLFSNDIVKRAILEDTILQKVNTGEGETYKGIKGQISDNSVERQIFALRGFMMSIPASPNHRRNHSNPNYGKSMQWPHRLTVSTHLQLLNTKIKEIDLDRADMKVLMKIIDTCNTTIPQVLTKIDLEAKLNSWDDERKNLIFIQTTIEKLLYEIQSLPSKLSKLNIDSIDESTGEKTFPPIEAYKSVPTLYEQLQALKTDWDKAVELPLVIEDDYVIERVGTSYLPDALLLFERFSVRVGEKNDKALKIVLEQVAIIHEQVLFVIEQHQEDSFDLMEAHTEFLKSKSRNLGMTSKNEVLSLNKKITSPAHLEVVENPKELDKKPQDARTGS